MEICKIIAERDLILALSHTMPEDALALVPEARKLGVKKIMTTHTSIPNPFLVYTLEQKRRAVKLGVLLEEATSCWDPVMMPLIGMKPADRREIVDHMKIIGPEHYCLASERGHANGPRPVEGMREFIGLLLDEGFSEPDIRMMASTNVSRLLGL